MVRRNDEQGLEFNQRIIDKIKEVFPEGDDNQYFTDLKIPYLDKEKGLTHTKPDLVLVTGSKIFVFRLGESKEQTLQFDEEDWVTESVFQESPIYEVANQCRWISNRYFFVHEEKIGWLQGMVIILAQHQSLQQIGIDQYNHLLDETNERGVILTPTEDIIPDLLYDVLPELNKGKMLDENHREKVLQFFYAHSETSIRQQWLDDALRLRLKEENEDKAFNDHHKTSSTPKYSYVASNNRAGREEKEESENQDNHKHAASQTTTLLGSNSTNHQTTPDNPAPFDKKVLKEEFEGFVEDAKSDLKDITQQVSPKLYEQLPTIKAHVQAHWKKALIVIVILIGLKSLFNMIWPLFASDTTEAEDRHPSVTRMLEQSEEEETEKDEAAEVEDIPSQAFIVALSRSDVQGGEDIALLNEHTMNELGIEEQSTIEVISHTGNTLSLTVQKDIGPLHSDHIRLNLEHREALGVTGNSENYQNYDTSQFESFPQDYKVTISW
ncbi:hypothetical protein [Caldalkalibacillus salinus]|uniref:hypothetical protein n=1 Tax=Caldalkalibacillus salinus TaxID=2803787 RepID=UPI001921D048|nr:hypothetical protein [Caldalkalibacillus salinus]